MNSIIANELIKGVMNLPLITVVIPTRGRPDIVVGSVHSALNQTYRNIEVIVVIDGPDPDTLEALKSVSDARLRVIELKENVGGSEARNIGVRKGNGSWIALLDDDDQWFPEKLAIQMSVADSSGRLALVTCRRIERQAGHPDVIAPRRTLRTGEDISDYMFYSDDKLRHTCGPQTSSFLATKELFLAVPFAKGLKCHQDWDWYLRAMNYDSVVATMIEQPLYVMDVEPQRPRMTHVARWQLSVEWLDSRKSLFTPRAYKSFLVNECMFRCEQTSKRFQIFKRLFHMSLRSGAFHLGDLATIAKWYLFRPTVRMRLRQIQRQIKAKVRGSQSISHSIETQSGKREVHG